MGDLISLIIILSEACIYNNNNCKIISYCEATKKSVTCNQNFIRLINKIVYLLQSCEFFLPFFYLCFHLLVARSHSMSSRNISKSKYSIHINYCFKYFKKVTIFVSLTFTKKIEMRTKNNK